MIDTVVLLLPQHAYQIMDPDKFIPSAVARAMADRSALSHHYFHGMYAKQNPTKKELLAGIYKPRLTLFPSANPSTRKATPGKYTSIVLKIELSLPKLFFGNNFQELKQKDLQPLLQRLADTLGQMEVIVDSLELAKAPVSAIHYSKNIVLKDGSTPYHYIQKIKEANIKLSLDTNQTDYRNEGHSYKWHCNSYEVVFYDKIKDLEKAKQSEKRSIEKDSALQLNLFPRFAQRKMFEILRMEVRLNKRQKIKQLFNKLGIKSDLSFKSLFKAATAKKILFHYLNELESKRPPLLDYRAVNDKSLIADLVFKNPDLGSKRILQMYGLSKALESITIRELRGMLSKRNQRDWNRLMGEAKEVKLPGSSSPFKVILEHIRVFKLLKLTKK